MESGKGTSAGRTSTLWRSFGHAWDGLVDSARGGRNMRIHLVAGVLAGSFAAIAPLAPEGRALILLCTALVIAAEAANTSLEGLVDLWGGGAPSEGARIAKDAAAGSVLALAAASVVVFALLASECWSELMGTWRHLPPGAAGLCLGAATARLLWHPVPSGAGITIILTMGVMLVTLLLATASCAPCVAVPALLLAVAADAARRHRAAHQQ